MNLKQSFETLGLKPGVDMAEVKRAYRRLAFALHPDLNPDVPDAVRRFQEVNEAYVYLSQAAASGRASQRAAGARAEADNAKAREEAQKAYAKARQGQNGDASRQASAERGKEEILKDILNDPFARRVFEDIYSHIRKDEPPKNQADPAQRSQARSAADGQPGRAASAKSQAAPAPGAGMFGKVKGWLRKQVDDEQVLRLPRESLVPGARVRLEIQHGFGGEAQVVELTLPPEFVPGKAMRLRGMGRRLGNLRGDLFVRIEAI